MKRLTTILVLWGLAFPPAGGAEPATRRVMLVSIDGLRWQEVFRGAEEALMDKPSGGVPENEAERLRDEYLGDSADDRRRRLMPFLWSTVAREGVIYGNRDAGSRASVSNTAWVSYPGYNELLTGRPDPRITNNARIPNPNVTVLEWLNGRPGFSGKVAASTAWNVFTAILNVERSRIPLFVTPQRSAPGTVSPRIAELEEWMGEIPPLTANEHFDVFAYRAARDMIAREHPRVFFLGLGEPDEWGHSRRYDRYLDSIRRCDRYLRELWEALQRMPEYRGRTTLVITTDHGRGVNGGDWTRHNAATPHSDEIWLAAIGPDTPALGERRDGPMIAQAQVAATLAALVGEDFRSEFPAAAPVIAEILGGADPSSRR